MTKSLLYTIGKNVPHVSLILLLIASVTLVGVPRVRAEGLTIVSVEPAEYEASAPGHNFTIYINITDVSRLGDWQFRLDYNTTLLDATWCSLTPISEMYSASLVPAPWTPTKGINDAAGYVVFGAGWPNAEYYDKPFNGSGPLLTINFTSRETGSGTLDLTVLALDSLGPYPYYDINLIPHIVMDGSITVVPEFPASIVTPLLLTTTLATAFLAKMVWSRKRKDALIAE